MSYELLYIYNEKKTRMHEQMSKGHCLKKKLHSFAQFWDQCQFLDIEFCD